VLDDAQFSIVILDESSQMIEPDALLAIGRFGAECCLMAGDPHQVCRLYGACVHHNTGAPACAHS
jgi:superfamily I DNA and/or RNA helicase